MDKNANEKIEIFITNLELENCQSLRQKSELFSEDYRKIIQEEILLLKKKKRLYQNMDN